MGDRTTLVIAHRLTTVESCARVVVLQDGVVVESGAFDALKDV
jgi:ABC-type multidrug transport system fused ATPase/permease subunit